MEVQEKYPYVQVSKTSPCVVGGIKPKNMQMYASNNFLYEISIVYKLSDRLLLTDVFVNTSKRRAKVMQTRNCLRVKTLLERFFDVHRAKLAKLTFYT